MTANAQYERVHAVEQDHWWFVGLRELVVEALRERLARGARVLDAGCGTGRVLAEMPADWERVGLDSNPGVLALARAQEGIEWVEGSIDALPFADASFDAVVSLDVLSDARVADPLKAAGELRRVLRPGGVLVLNLPAYRWLMSGHDIVAQTGRRYTAKGVARLLAELGFGERRVGYRMTALFPVAVARRLARRGGASTDVGAVPARLNAVLTQLLRIENRIVRRVRLPFGLSVFAVAAAAPARRLGLKDRLLANRRLAGLAQFAAELNPRKPS